MIRTNNSAALSVSLSFRCPFQISLKDGIAPLSRIPVDCNKLSGSSFLVAGSSHAKSLFSLLEIIDLFSAIGESDDPDHGLFPCTTH